MFLQHKVFCETSYQRNIISKTLEAGWKLSRTGSKHDGAEARRENPKLDETPNFGIMKVFDEDEGLGNIYRQERGVNFSAILVSTEARGVAVHEAGACELTCGTRGGSTKHEACILTCGRRFVVLHEADTGSQPCGARGAAAHASGAMRSDTRASTNLKLIGQSVPLMIKWRCCPELVQFHGFRSVEVLLDTPPRSPKNCPGAKRGSVQSSRDVHLGFWLSDQPAASCLEHYRVAYRVEWSHCCMVPVIFKDSVVAGGRTIWSSLGKGVTNWLSCLVIMLLFRDLGHIGRSPGCDVDTTGPMPYRLDYESFLGIIVSSVCYADSRSVEVLLDTPPGSPKSCPEAKGGSVRVQISLSRPVSFFMVKPRLCPRQDQSSPLQSSRQLGFGQVFSDQPAASRLEHLQVPVIFKYSVVAGGRTIWGIFGHIGQSPSCDVGTTGPMPYRPDY
ncbi:hypothetical protein F2Q69_00019922 [Brassica cretica]|uniref:Uncharacterized protein n=1 Tax=Brassica cretica TaxID=69181 RepID=A0A8S9Q6H4_BRACR|nr:hypothetical protein F2Q69_00019922 [Brassica cretica]